MVAFHLHLDHPRGGTLNLWAWLLEAPDGCRPASAARARKWSPLRVLRLRPARHSRSLSGVWYGSG